MIRGTYGGSDPADPADPGSPAGVPGVAMRRLCSDLGLWSLVLPLLLLLAASVRAEGLESVDEKYVGRVQALESELQRDLGTGTREGNITGEGTPTQSSPTEVSSTREGAGSEAGAARAQEEPGKDSGSDTVSDSARNGGAVLTGEPSAATLAAGESRAGDGQAGESQATESDQVKQEDWTASNELKSLPGETSAASLASGGAQQGQAGGALSPEERADVSSGPTLEAGAAGQDEASKKGPSGPSQGGGRGHYEFASEVSVEGRTEVGTGTRQEGGHPGAQARSSRGGPGSGVGPESSVEASWRFPPADSGGGGEGSRSSEASSGDYSASPAEAPAKPSAGTETESATLTTGAPQRFVFTDEAASAAATKSTLFLAPAPAPAPWPALATAMDSQGGEATDKRTHTVAFSEALPQDAQQTTDAQDVPPASSQGTEEQRPSTSSGDLEVPEGAQQEQGPQGGAAETHSASQGSGAQDPLPQALPPSAYLRGTESAASGPQDRSEVSGTETKGAQALDGGGAEQLGDMGSDPLSVASQSHERKRREKLRKAKALRDKKNAEKKKRKKKPRIKTKKEKLKALEKRRRRQKGGSRGGGQAGEASSRPLESRTFSAVVHRGHRDPRTVIGSRDFFKSVAEMQALGGPKESVHAVRRNASMHRWPLTKNLSRSDMTLEHLVRIYDKCPDTPTCPSFAPCGAFQHPYQICRSHAFHALPESVPAPRDTCPGLAPSPALSAGSGLEDAAEEEVVLPNPACLHRPDGWWSDGVPLHVFQLHGMYIDLMGVTFDEKTVVDRNGCVRDREDLFFEAGTLEVTHVDRAVGLFYNHAVNFFHGLIELLPLFITVSPFLRADPSMPIVMKCAEWLAYLELGEPVVGIRASDLNVICIETAGILCVSELIQPMFPECGSASPELFFELRRRFYLPHDGLPFFDPDWRIRGQDPLSLEDMEEVPEDWVVVLAHRPAKDRSLSIQGIIRDELVRQFGATRVVLFDGKLRILEAKALFNRALLYVGVHGAAMSNMIFMPAKTFVWEFRPRSYPNGCYKSLAEISGLHYHLTWGEGSKETPLVVNASDALADLSRISKSLHELIDLEPEPSQQGE